MRNQQRAKIITNTVQILTAIIARPPSDLAAQEELFPINSPELGAGANASEFWEVGEGKNDDISGAFTYGKIAGEAEITGSLVEHRKCRLRKKMTARRIADDAETVEAIGDFIRWSQRDKYSEFLKEKVWGMSCLLRVTGLTVALLICADVRMFITSLSCLICLVLSKDEKRLFYVTAVR